MINRKELAKLITRAWTRAVKEKTAPDLSGEADRSHFWTKVMHIYKQGIPYPNYSGAMAFIMADAVTLEELIAGIQASLQIPENDKSGLIEQISAAFDKASTDWRSNG